ncbi:MAG: elongation factor G [Clostridiales bacterium]|nr:MAG: elongation factor G [Clostridiales bacterium]
MKTYNCNQIRNVTLLGHGGSGKTTIIEAILFDLGLSKRMGKVESGNTQSDYSKEEISRGFSITTSVFPLEWKNSKINLLDTPGYFDFVAETVGALEVSGGAVILVDASSGIEVGTEKAWAITESKKMPRIIFINKMDKENIEYMKLITELKEHFGKKIAPFVIPMGDGDAFEGYIDVVDRIGRKVVGNKIEDVPVPEELKGRLEEVREILIESVAESDEELLDKYFEGEEFTLEEIKTGLRKGVLEGEVVPVIVGSAEKKIGTTMLLDSIINYMPTPSDMHGGIAEGVVPGTDEKIERKVSKDEPFSALVFKSIADPFLGTISLFKVMSGSLKKDMEVYNPNREATEKIGSVFLMRGKKQIEVDELSAGDIGATAKLSKTRSGNTLTDSSKKIMYPQIQFPKPGLFKAIEPRSKGDEEKIGSALSKLNDEDPSFLVNRNKETRQMIIGSQGNMQLSVIVSKLKDLFDVEVDIIPQKIAYRETIKGTATVQGKHKKQSGGAGQYGDVHIKFEPSGGGFVFEEKIFGGAVPKSYFPAVEKGLEESMLKGPLAGFKVVDVKATLLDGSYHNVDSSEMAFKIAASLAFKKGIIEAQPILLEPIMHLEVSVPDDYMGDVMGDMNKRRGRILGMEPSGMGYQKIIAEAPEAELFTYLSDLRSMTQARGSFTVEFSRYEEVPAALAQKVIEANKEE